MIELRDVTPVDAAVFADWQAALAAGQRDGRTAAVVATLQELTDSFAVPSPLTRQTAIAALIDGRCVGAMLLGEPLGSDVDTTTVELAVPGVHRRQGVGAALWDRAEQQARESGRSIFHTDVHLPTGATLESWPGAQFATSRGFTSVHVEDHLVAELPFNADRLANLEARHGASAGYRVESWVGRCPERFVAALADLHSAMSQDLPTGDLTRDAIVYTPERMRIEEGRLEKNWLSLTALAVTDAGEPAGYSIIYLPRTQPEHALQDDTLVLRVHRGHDLGSRLKVANLRQLEGLPGTVVGRRRWLHTYTAQENAPMQRVNARFDFRTVEALHEFELIRHPPGSVDRVVLPHAVR